MQLAGHEGHSGLEARYMALSYSHSSLMPLTSVSSGTQRGQEEEVSSPDLVE